MSKKNIIIVVAYLDRGAGNDPKLFYFYFGGGGGSLSPPRLNIFYSGQYESNDLPRPRRSALSECF